MFSAYQLYEIGPWCVFDTDIFPPVIRVAISATTFINKINVSTED